MFAAIRRERTKNVKSSVGISRLLSCHAEWKNKFFAPFCRIEEQQCGGAKYLLVTLSKFPDNANQRLKKILFRHCGTAHIRMVPEEGIPLFPPFCSELFMRLLLFNTTLHIMERLGQKQEEIPVILIDIRGVAAGFIPKLACCCKQVSVITCRPERYARRQQQLIWEEGIAITVTAPRQHIVNLGLCLVADDGGGMFNSIFPETGIILRCCGSSQREKDFTLASIEAPEWAAQQIPPGFSPITFLGAVYEYGREERCGKISVSELKDYNGNSITIEELIDKLQNKSFIS